MTRRDINVVVLTGTIQSAPTFVSIRNNKRILLFTLKNCEHFELSDGTPAVHENFFTIEVFGKNAERYLQTLRVGRPYQISGYIRADEIHGADVVRVRAYRIDSMEVLDGYD